MNTTTELKAMLLRAADELVACSYELTTNLLHFGDTEAEAEAERRAQELRDIATVLRENADVMAAAQMLLEACRAALANAENLAPLLSNVLDPDDDRLDENDAVIEMCCAALSSAGEEI